MTDTPNTVPYVNDALMRDKLEAIFLEQRRRNALKEKDASTYLEHTHSDEGGRFAAVNKQQVTGSEQAVHYPTLPAGNPFADAPLGIERSLGYSIEDHEPVGEWFEQTQSFDVREGSSPPHANVVAEEQLDRTEQDCSSDNLAASPDATGPDAAIPGVASSAPTRSSHHPSGRVAGPAFLPLTKPNGGLR
jgi:hypothetical protein